MITEPLAPREAAALLRATLAALKAQIGALRQDQLIWRPSESDWCINEIIGHLIETEERGYAGRIQSILENDHPQFEPWDQQAVARERGDQHRDGRALLGAFEQVRLNSIQLVENIALDQLNRSGLHPVVGELTVHDLLHAWIFHDQNHMQQIGEQIKGLMWMHMRNSRRFSQPDG
jgi:DinB family protein